MKNYIAPSLAVGTLFSLLVPLASALSYDTSHLPYSDVGVRSKEAVSISLLTDEGIVQGNPDGTFRPSSTLNRAEFIQILMKTLREDLPDVTRDCFPDVDSNAWYAPAVCRAETLGYVRGNAEVGVPQSQWRFEPIRAVNYAEAVTVLIKLYNISVTPTSNQLWYEAYIMKAKEKGVDIPGLRPGDKITRGEMARLTAAFIAEANGELALLRDAEERAGSSSSSSSRSSSSRSSSSSSSVSSRSSSSSSRSSTSLDPITDVTTDSDFLLLGEQGSIIASGTAFMSMEALNVTDIVVNLSTAASSLDALYVYDEDRRFLGLATKRSSTEYRLTLAPGTIRIPRNTDWSFYVRARTMSATNGGVSGQNIQVLTIRIEGKGEDSSSSYSKVTTETFPAFETTRARITSIARSGAAEESLLSGTQRQIGSFKFMGTRSDNAAQLRINALTFQLSQNGGASVSNVKLARADSSERYDCSVSGSEISCPSIPASLGQFSDELTLTLYADVALNNPSANATVSTALNDAGTISDDGSITWTDGTSTFTWVAFSDPVAQGTVYRY